MSLLADQIELADAEQTIAQAERYLRYLRSEGEYAPKPPVKQSWLDLFSINFPPMPQMAPYCPTRERVEWAEMVIAKRNTAA